MKMFFITFLMAITASVQAARPLTKQGCQCLSDCKICSSYHSLTGCGTWQLTKLCNVNKQTCDDYTYNRGGKVGDECGSWKDAFTDLYAKMKSWFHKSAKSIKHLSAKVEEWADEYVKAIDIDDLLKTEQDIVPKLVRVWGRLDDKQLSQLKAASSEAWEKIVAEIPPEDLAALKTAIQTKLDIAKRIAGRLKSITLEDVSKWSKEQWDRVPIDNLASMSWSALQKVPLTELGQWVQEQWVKIPVDKLVRFTGAQINKIDAKSFAALTDKYWDKVPVYHITHFAIELLQATTQNGLLAKLNATEIAYLTANQWKSVPIEAITQFTVEKIQAIDYTALGAWSKGMWDKFPIDKILAFVDQQIQAVPPSVVGNWTKSMWLKFPTDKAVMFTGTQLIAGANVLKDLTLEQLAKYDWEQIGEDALKELPTELQEKIKILRKYATNFNVTAYKERVFRVTEAKKTRIRKLEELQVVNDDPVATVEKKQAAEEAYSLSLVNEEQAIREVQSDREEVQADSLQMYELPASDADLGARATFSAAALLTVLWFQN